MTEYKTYAIQDVNGGPLKIGKANKPKRRLGELQTGYPYKLRIVGVIDADIEDTLHEKLASDHLYGEWFENTEHLRTVLAEFGITIETPANKYKAASPLLPEEAKAAAVILATVKRMAGLEPQAQQVQAEQLLPQILADVLEYSKRTMVGRLRNSRKHIRDKSGRCEGRKPYGDRPGELDTLARMLALWQEHANYHTVAASLNDTGMLARSGGLWTAATVRRILLRQ